MNTIESSGRDEEEFEAFWDTPDDVANTLMKAMAKDAYLTALKAERERSAGLVEEMKELRECVRVLRETVQYYADGAKDDLEPKPEKAHLYDHDYPMSHPLWRQRSMSDYIGGKRARAVLKDHAKTIERCL